VDIHPLRCDMASRSTTSNTPFGTHSRSTISTMMRPYLRPSRTGTLLEVINLVRGDDDGDLVIHAMTMRPKYRPLPPGA
jgi:hypothetical protein